MREFVDRYQRAAVNFGNPSVPMDEKVRPPSVSSIKNRAMLMMHPELVVKNASKLKRSVLSELYDEEED
jgi:imidazoleglycerol phosphate dehydratase HisB